MKKILMLLMVVGLFSSCGINKLPYTSNIYVLDYKYFTEKGFFITESNSVNFDYEPVGSISVLISSGYVKSEKELAKQNSKKSFDDSLYPFVNSYGSKFIAANYNDALDMIYDEAKAQGGNGVINLKTASYPAVYNEKGILLSESYITVSGMVIKK